MSTVMLITGANEWTHILCTHRLHSLTYVMPSLPHTGE